MVILKPRQLKAKSPSLPCKSKGCTCPPPARPHQPPGWSWGLCTCSPAQPISPNLRGSLQASGQCWARPSHSDLPPPCQVLLLKHARPPESLCPSF